MKHTGTRCSAVTSLFVFCPTDLGPAGAVPDTGTSLQAEACLPPPSPPQHQPWGQALVQPGQEGRHAQVHRILQGSATRSGSHEAVSFFFFWGGGVFFHIVVDRFYFYRAVLHPRADSMHSWYDRVVSSQYDRLISSQYDQLISFIPIQPADLITI